MAVEGPIPVFEGDSEEFSIKKIEELYRYSCYIFDGEVQRIERVNTTIQHFLAGSLILLGLSAAWLSKMIDGWSPPLCAAQWLLLTSASLSIILLGVGVFSFFHALRFRRHCAAPAGKDQLERLYAHAYVRVLATLSLEIMRAAMMNQAIWEQRNDRTKLGYHCVKVSIVLSILTFLGYIWTLVSP